MPAVIQTADTPSACCRCVAASERATFRRIAPAARPAPCCAAGRTRFH